MTLAVVTAQEMREMDRITIEEIGVPGVVLMELAGRGVADLVERLAPSLLQWRVAVFCGAGNNGGDGYVAARHLVMRGAEVTIFMLAPRDRITGDALINLEAAEKLGLDFEWMLGEPDRESLVLRLTEFDCVVDALLGTGLSSEVRGRYRNVVDAINAARTLTLAVDIPSGLSADTGHPLGVAVEADATVTFGYPKTGLCTYPGPEYVGQLHRVDIGIPPDLPERLGVQCHLLSETHVRERLPVRRVGGHKGTYGHVLVVAGSHGKTGAAMLCARAANRVGAGLVTVAVPTDVQAAVEAQSLETMSETYAATEESLDSDETTRRLLELSSDKRAVVLGPGIPTHSGMRSVIRDLLTELDIPVVIDADGLNVLAGDPRPLSDANSEVIVTPHPGEMARLTKTSVADVQADRVAVARRFAADHQVLVVLKGACTVLATPGGEAFINPTGNPGMGSGGVGDLLTGLLGGLLVQRVSPLDALQLGVFLHGLAGDQAAQRLGQHSLVAGDLLEEIPVILKRWADGPVL